MSEPKDFIEDDKLVIPDYETIAELTTFISKRDSFEAEEGCHDDLAMCLVIFCGLAVQDYFQEMTDNDVRPEFTMSRRIKLNRTWHYLVSSPMV